MSGPRSCAGRFPTHRLKPYRVSSIPHAARNPLSASHAKKDSPGSNPNDWMSSVRASSCAGVTCALPISVSNPKLARSTPLRRVPSVTGVT